MNRYIVTIPFIEDMNFLVVAENEEEAKNFAYENPDNCIYIGSEFVDYKEPTKAIFQKEDITIPKNATPLVGIPRMKQLEMFVEWHKEHHPGVRHIAEWALEDLKRLTKYSESLEKELNKDYPY